MDTIKIENPWTGIEAEIRRIVNEQVQEAVNAMVPFALHNSGIGTRNVECRLSPPCVEHMRACVAEALAAYERDVLPESIARINRDPMNRA